MTSRTAVTSSGSGASESCSSSSAGGGGSCRLRMHGYERFQVGFDAKMLEAAPLSSGWGLRSRLPGTALFGPGHRHITSTALFSVACERRRRREWTVPANNDFDLGSLRASVSQAPTYAMWRQVGTSGPMMRRPNSEPGSPAPAVSSTCIPCSVFLNTSGNVASQRNSRSEHLKDFVSSSKLTATRIRVRRQTKILEDFLHSPYTIKMVVAEFHSDACRHP